MIAWNSGHVRARRQLLFARREDLELLSRYGFQETDVALANSAARLADTQGAHAQTRLEMAGALVKIAAARQTPLPRCWCRRKAFTRPSAPACPL